MTRFSRIARWAAVVGFSLLMLAFLFSAETDREWASTILFAGVVLTVVIAPFGAGRYSFRAALRRKRERSAYWRIEIAGLLVLAGGLVWLLRQPETSALEQLLGITLAVVLFVDRFLEHKLPEARDNPVRQPA